MTAVGAAAAWFLAGVFAWAGAAKLFRHSATRTTFAALGLPAARLLARLVPVVELMLALALVRAPRSAAVVAIAVLASFSALLVLRWRAGSTVPCGCFGGVRAAPPGAGVLVRNGLLGLTAMVALWSAETTGLTVGLPTLPAVLALGAAVAAGWVVIALLDLRSISGRLWDNRAEATLIAERLHGGMA